MHKRKKLIRLMLSKCQIDLLTCRFDRRVYVRKSIEKRMALRYRDVRDYQSVKMKLIRFLAMLSTLRAQYTSPGPQNGC